METDRSVEAGDPIPHSGIEYGFIQNSDGMHEALLIILFSTRNLGFALVSGMEKDQITYFRTAERKRRCFLDLPFSALLL